MISHNTLKLVVGLVIGGAVYYKYSKGKAKQTKINKKFNMGAEFPIPMINHPFKRMPQPKHKEGMPLKKSHEFYF